MSTPQYSRSRPNFDVDNQWQTNEVTAPFVHDNSRTFRPFVFLLRINWTLAVEPTGTYIVLGYILLLNFLFLHPGERSQRRAVHPFLILVVLVEQDDLLEFIAAVQSLDIQSTGEAANDASRFPSHTECN